MKKEARFKITNFILFGTFFSLSILFHLIMQPRKERIVFIARDCAFEHKHVVLDLAQVQSLPRVKAHFDQMISSATTIRLGAKHEGRIIHYLCSVFWWSGHSGTGIGSPWSDAAHCWKHYAEWGNEMIMIQQGHEYARLEKDEVGRSGAYNLHTDLIDAALNLEKTLKAEGRDVSYIIVVDELRRDVPEAIYDALLKV